MPQLASGDFMQPSLAQVETEIVDILKDMTQDWGLDEDDEIGPSTRLVGDLEFSSVDIIHLVVAIEEKFNRPRMGFEELLMVEGRYVDDLEVKQVAEFVNKRLGGEG